MSQKSFALRCAIAALTAWAATSNAIADEAARSYQIPQQPLDQALREFALKSNLDLLFSPDLVDGKYSPILEGKFTVDEGLRALLHGSGLEFSVRGSQVVISEANEKSKLYPTISATTTPSRFIRVAQTEQSLSGDASDAGTANAQLDAGSRVQLEEVIVTGSQIRGVQPVGAPLIVIGREEIQRSGYSSIQQLMESLPQAYGGDASEDVFSTNDDQENTSGATGINLRGLNASSTLTLLNGRRMALSGAFGAGFADISTLPLSAVERVEILTDGASAIYGSDAIAGVVNFILRDDYEGAETRLRYGSVTSGSLDEIQLAQTFGKHWSGGHALLSYEYHDRGRLGREERSFSASRDLRPFGGDDFSDIISRPGNLYSSELGFPSGQDGSNLTTADLGPMNLESRVLGEDFVGESERHSLFVMVEHALTDKFDIYGDFRYSSRDYRSRGGAAGIFSLVSNTHPNFVSPTGATSEYVAYSLYDEVGAFYYESTNKVLSGALGTRWDLGRRWQADFYAAYARDKVRTDNDGIDSGRLAETLGFDDPTTPYDPNVDGYLNVFGDVGRNPQNVLDYIMSGGGINSRTGELRTVNAKVDGPLFSLPGGEIKMAFGGEYRKESLQRAFLMRSGGQLVNEEFSFADTDRSISAAFGEVIVPVFGGANARTGLQRLDVSAALRHERYSDFGSSTDPKFGITWELIDGLALRASYGTSFKAPRLSESLPQARNIVVGPLLNPLSPTGSSIGMWLFGSGAGLTPETSTTWTAGMDLEFKALPGLHIQTTYFDIDFKDRIASINLISAFMDQEYFAPVLTFDPDDELVQSYLNSPHYTGPLVDPSTVEVIMDSSKRNIASTVVKGVDMDVRYSMHTALAQMTFGLNGSYLFDFKNALVPGAALREQVSTLGHPTDLRLRGSVGVHRDAVGATIFVNYTDEYDDLITSAVPRKVDSWTTIDFTLSYTAPRTSGWLAGTRMFLSAVNLFDKDPPFVNNSSPSMTAYDPANADPTGRFVSFSITKEWR